MPYTLTLKVISCIAPEGEYYVVLAKNKTDKKERNESRTSATKKMENPSWTHMVEMIASPTDELLFDLYRSKKHYATGSLMVGLIDSNKNNEIKMTFKDPTSLKPNTKICVLTVWASFVKTGAIVASQAPAKEPSRNGLRMARVGPQGSTARPITTNSAESSSTASSSSSSPVPTSSPGKRSNDSEKTDKTKTKTKKSSKQTKKGRALEEDSESVEDSDEVNTDDEFADEPPRRKSRPKKTVVPEDEDPIDFWNGVSKSKTKEKKKDIKKLQQSLESMTINLKSSWRDDSVANQQQRFAVLLQEIGSINADTDACAGHTRLGQDLLVKLAFPIDLTTDNASGCGIDQTKWIYIELTFPAGIYLSEEPKAASKTLLIRQCPPMSSSDEIVGFHEPTQFGLWWTLEQRLTTYFKNEWESIIAAANKAAKSAAKNASALGSSDAWAMLEILEWPTTNLPIAMKALEESKNDVKMALELVLDEPWLEAAKLTTNSEDEKKSLDHKLRCSSQFLRNTIETLRHMIDDSGKFCPICGDPHPLELFKPIVCGNELCKFQFSNMGLGVDFESELIHSPMAVDLLISMTSNAVIGNHFDPFPSEVTTQISGITHSFKKPLDIGACISRCPSVDEMIELAKEGKLRSHLDTLHPLLYLLLRWIVTSSRAHLHFLTGDEVVPQVNSPYQFHLKSTPPEKEQKFYAAKKRYGSFYAWHGSATSNWHSILRNGLKNYSNSKYQANGAAYGPGVYMAVDSGTSIGYSWHGNTAYWSRSRFEGPITVLALCEVINEGEIICTGNVHRPRCIHSTSAPFYRIEKDEYIATRYLFVINDRNMHITASSIQSHIKSKQLLRSNKAVKTKKAKR